MGSKVERNADPVHLVQTQIRHGKKRTFSESFFPGVTTKTAKTNCTNAFAEDIGVRSRVKAKALLDISLELYFLISVNLDTAGKVNQQKTFQNKVLFDSARCAEI